MYSSVSPISKPKSRRLDWILHKMNKVPKWVTQWQYSDCDRDYFSFTSRKVKFVYRLIIDSLYKLITKGTWTLMFFCLIHKLWRSFVCDQGCGPRSGSRLKREGCESMSKMFVTHWQFQWTKCSYLVSSVMLKSKSRKVKNFKVIRTKTKAIGTAMKSSCCDSWLCL